MKSLVLGLAIAAIATACVAAPSDRGDDPIGALIADRQEAGLSQVAAEAHLWKPGERIGSDIWSSARPVNYRRHHLRQPLRGYQWRESNGQYVLADRATGLIAATALSH
jgi:Ni/Co efflux regulator RcnB